MKTGLIIQGPLFSPGFGPYEFQSNGSFEKSWIAYDCVDNIQSIIKVADNLFDVIVIATWENSTYTVFLEKLRNYYGVEIVLLNESERLQELHQLGTHKYHQIETLRAGASKLEELGCDVVAKVRSDHNVNLEILYKHVDQHRGKNENSLGVPNINLFELDRLTDFYFVGRVSVILGLCDYYLSRPELCPDPHKDYFLKFLTFLSSDDFLVDKIQNFKSPLIRDFYCIFVWTHYFYPLHAGLFKTFFWRGRRVNYRLNGWIRWFYAFHSSRNFFSSWKFPLNLFAILSVRELKRPTIRFSSAILFRLYRLKSQRSL
jgi:hypothetical protein